MVIKGTSFLNIRRNKDFLGTQFSVKRVNTGFMLIELVVVLGIIGLFTGITLVNYGSARDSSRFDGVMQTMILSLREAQIYGTAVLETTGGSFDDAYGVYFEPGEDEYMRFIDLDDSDLYDDVVTEHLETVSLPNGFVINDVCVSNLTETCSSGSPLINGINILFVRPNPDANIYMDIGFPLGPYKSSRIEIQNASGDIQNIIVQNTGQIYIQ